MFFLLMIGLFSSSEAHVDPATGNERGKASGLIGFLCGGLPAGLGMFFGLKGSTTIATTTAVKASLLCGTAGCVVCSCAVYCCCLKGDPDETKHLVDKNGGVTPVRTYR